MQIDINSAAIHDYTEKLAKMHRSALPNAVRETLNRAALNVKQITMPREAKKQFINRAPNFFKANSKVDFAKGYNVKTMQSEVGFIEDKLKNKSTNYAVKDLEQQENSGTIKGKSFIATKKARTGNSNSKLVRKINQLKQLEGNIIQASDTRGNKKQAWIRAAIMAKKLHGNNAFVMGNKWGDGRQTVSRIGDISTSLKTRKLVIERTPVYSFKKGRHVSVKGTRFMERASLSTATNIELIYIEEARKQIERIRK